MKDEVRMNLDSDWWLGRDNPFTWSGLFLDIITWTKI